MKVSIIIPTRNAGKLFEAVLAGISEQRFERGSVELVVIDSGSTDGTVELARRFGGTVYEISPEEFSHGATRDLAISRCQSELIVLLVQDAVPAGSGWLDALVREFDEPAIAASYCRQLARPDCRAVTARRLANWISGSNSRIVKRLNVGQKLEDLEPFEQLRLCNFDNVCSSLRKSVWEEHRFGAIAFAEDLDWSKRVIAAGHSISFTPHAEVIHSHNRSLRYEYRRTYLAHHTLYRLFALRTVPDLRTALGSLRGSAELIKHSLQHDPGVIRKWLRATRAPVEQIVMAFAQYSGARDAAQGLPPRQFREI